MLEITRQPDPSATSPPTTVGWRLRKHLLVAVICTMSAGASAVPSKARAYHTYKERLLDTTAYSLERREFRLGAMKLSYGIFKHLEISTYTLPWLAGQGFLGAVSFPAGSFAWRQHRELGLIGPQASGSLPVHPVQLYEFLLLAVLILVLRRREHRWATPGTTMLVALASYAVLRFFVEFLRADNALVLGSLTADQLICIALLAACVTLIGIRRPAASSAKQPVFDSPRPPPEKGGRH